MQTINLIGSPVVSEIKAISEEFCIELPNCHEIVIFIDTTCLLSLHNNNNYTTFKNSDGKIEFFSESGISKIYCKPMFAQITSSTVLRIIGN